jgi:hypothetical protein
MPHRCCNWKNSESSSTKKFSNDATLSWLVHKNTSLFIKYLHMDNNWPFSSLFFVYGTNFIVSWYIFSCLAVYILFSAVYFCYYATCVIMILYLCWDCNHILMSGSCNYIWFVRFRLFLRDECIGFMFLYAYALSHNFFSIFHPISVQILYNLF